MRKKHILTYLFLCLGMGLFAQNPLTIVAPKYIKNSVALNLPTGPATPGINDPEVPFDYYDGEPAAHASNGIADANNNLKFFVVDGLIYDSDGAYVAYAWGQLNPNYDLTGDPNNIYDIDGDGGGEILIVPHPTDCNVYYFFGAVVTSVNQNGQQTVDSKPVYAIYNAETKVVTKRGAWYANPIDPANPGPEIFSMYTSALNGDQAVTGGEWGEEVIKNGILSLGATEAQADGSRFVMAFLKSKLVVVKIYPDGSLGYWKRHIIANGSNSKRRSEFEVKYRSADNSYLLACSSFYNGTVTNDCIVHVCNFSSNFLVKNDQDNFTFPSSDNNPNIAAIHGLEFSPSLNNLFITNSTSDLVANTLHYVNLGVNPPVLQALPHSSATNFKNGYIESDGTSLYIGSATGLYKITNPNSTSGFTISSSAVIPFTYTPNYSSFVLQTEEQKAYTLPDQIDGMNYHDMVTADVECCIAFTLFDKNSFTATTNGTWTGGIGNNPIAGAGNNSNTVTIRNELRIPKGKVVTIQNMTLKFAPGAKLIIEEGDGVLDGGRLVLDQTILTVDLGCSTDMMWNGVEVWGRNTYEQGSAYGSSQQGRLIMQNGSIIEHASKGVVLGAFDNINGTYSTTKGGGIIVANGSSFQNNQRDVVARSYVSPSGLNNVSALTDCSFLVNTTLKGGLTPISRVEFYQMKGMNVSGCTFSVTATPHLRTGYGIFSRNTTFNANARCASQTSPCTSYDPNIFENFNFGIYVTNTSATDAFSADRNTFINNNIGIRASSSNSSVVTRNTFKVFENAASQTTGLYMTSSTGFTIQENSFGISNTTPLANAKTYGIVISNSTVNPNLVYNNSFTKLYVGGQSEGINASTVLGDASGLVWKCNNFVNPIAAYDLSVMNGRICYNQGYTDPSSAAQAALKAANNRFSLTGEAMSLMHDFFLSNSQSINYVYNYPAGMGMIPDSYTTTYMTIQPSVTDFGCPSLLSGGKTGLIQQRTTLEGNLSEAEKSMETNTDPEVVSEYNQLKRELDLNISQQLSAVLLTAEDHSILEKEVELLNVRHEEELNQIQFDLNLKKGDTKAAFDYLNKMSGVDYTLNKIYMDIQLSGNPAKYLTDNPAVVSVLEEISKNEDNPLMAERADNQLEEIYGFETTYSFAVAEPAGSSELSIGEFTSNDIIVYPNPSQGSLLVENNDISGVIEVIDLTGKVVYTKATTERNTILDLTGLNEGVYILKLTDSSTMKQLTAKVVKK